MVVSTVSRRASSLFARLERAAILQALSVDVDAEVSHQRTLTSAVIERLAEKFGKRRQAKHAEVRSANSIAVGLRTRARQALEEAFNQLKGPVSAVASEDREYVSQDFFLCSLEPFVFAYKTNEEDIADAFARWLDAAVAVAIKEYGDRL